MELSFARRGRMASGARSPCQHAETEMTASLLDAITGWFSGFVTASADFSEADIETDEDLFDPAVSPLEEFN